MEHTQKNWDWQYSRLGKFTASEIHKLFSKPKSGNGMFGEGALTYIRQKAAECLTMEVKDEVNSYSITWGYQYEKEACKLYEKATGVEGIYYGKENPKFFEWKDYAGGSPDWQGETIEPIDMHDKGLIGADFKCPYNSDIHLANLQLKSAEDLLKQHKDYYIQAQSNILFCDWDQFDFVSYDPRFRDERLRLKILTIYPDKCMIGDIKERLAAAEEVKQQIINELLNP